MTTTAMPNYRKRSRVLMYRQGQYGTFAGGRVYAGYAPIGPLTNEIHVIATVLADDAEPDRMIMARLTIEQAREFAARLIAAADDAEAGR